MRGYLGFVVLVSAVLLWGQAESGDSGNTKAANTAPAKAKEQVLAGARKVALVGAVGHVAQYGIAMNPSEKKAQELLEKEVRKWGRFTVVEDPTKADLVLVLWEGNRAAGGGGVIRTARLAVIPGGQPPKRGDIPLWDDDANGSILGTSGAPKVIAKFRQYLESLDRMLPSTARVGATEADAAASATSPTPSAGASAGVTASVPQVSSPAQNSIATKAGKYVPPFDIINRARTYALRGKGAAGEQWAFEKAFSVGKYSDIQSAMGRIHQQMTLWDEMQLVQDVSAADLVIVVYQWDTRTYSRQFHGVRTAIQVAEGRDAFQRNDPALWVSGTVNDADSDLIGNLRFELQLAKHVETLAATHDANRSYNRGNDWLESAEKKVGSDRSDLLFEAVAELRKSLRSDYGYAPAHERLATTLRELGFQSNAVYEYKLALQLQPGMQDALHGLAEALISIADYEEAINVVQECIRTNPDKVDGYLLLGKAEYFKKDYAAAAKAYQDAIYLDSKNALAHEKRGRALYRDKKMQEAEPELSEALRLNPDNEEIAVWLGSTLNEETKFGEAEVILRRAVKLNSKDGAAHYELARSLRGLKNYDQALAEIRAALTLEPTAATYHGELAHTLAAAGKNEEALAKFREITKNVPDSSTAHMDLGVMLLTMSQADAAVRELEQAVQLDEKCAPAFYHLGRARQANGDPAGAQSAFEMARTLDPQNEDFLKAGR